MTLWNGNKAALSLTFDDGLACQAEHAIPMLDERGIKGTFFIVAKNLGRCTEAWKAASTRGHEIGSHSFAHFKARLVTTDEGRYAETVLSKLAIEQTLATTVESYAYPYALTDEPMMDAVRKAYKQARGGHASPGPMHIKPNVEGVNLFLTRSQNMCAGHVNEIGQMIEQTLAVGGWLTLMFHGVGPDDTQFDNIHGQDFKALVAKVASRQRDKLWVATYREVAQNVRDNWRK